MLLLFSNAKHKIRTLLRSTSHIARGHCQHAYIVQLLFTQAALISWWIHALNLLAVSFVKDNNYKCQDPLLLYINLALKRIHCVLVLVLLGVRRSAQYHTACAPSAKVKM